MNSAPVKIVHMLAHAYWGIAQVLFVLPFSDSRERDRRLVVWSRKLLAILAVECRVVGSPPAPGQGALLTANHVSWLDIHALHTLLPARFISKSEVRGWPLIGRLAKSIGTLFIERAKRADAHRINQEVVASLTAGECVAFFPEGTSTDGCQLLPFYAALFQPAVDAAVPVVPVALRYLTPAGKPCDAAAYCGDLSFGQSLLRIAREKALIVELRFLPVIDPTGHHRRDLARRAEAAVREALGIA